MDIASLTGISSDFIKEAMEKNSNYETKDAGFDTVFKSAVDMLNETNDLQNSAEEAEIQFALGKSNNTHDLRIAQDKANIALQYTVAVRDKMVEAYREIMNMQI